MEVDEMPEGQLCERLRHYEVHESHSATRGQRGAMCIRPAKGKDWAGRWACGIHLGADKRGEQNRKRGEARRAWKNSKGRAEWLASEQKEKSS